MIISEMINSQESETALSSVGRFLEGLSNLGVDRIMAEESSDHARIRFLTKTCDVLTYFDLETCYTPYSKYYTMDMYDSDWSDALLEEVRRLARECHLLWLDFVREEEMVDWGDPDNPGLSFVVDTGKSDYRLRLNCPFGTWFMDEIVHGFAEGRDRNVVVSRLPWRAPVISPKDGNAVHIKRPRAEQTLQITPQ